MPYIFLDESGNLTKTDGKYFVVASFSVGDPKRITKAFRKWQQSKFPKKLRHQAEIKFNNSSLDDTLRRKTLQYLAQQDIRIFYTYLSTMNIPDEYIRKDRVHETGLLYLEIMGATLELYLPLTTAEFRVFRDQRSTKGMSSGKFNDILKTRLLPKLPAKTLMQIEAVDSTTSTPVQVVDWVCGALARYHEGKPGGQEFYDILKPNIVEQKELFSKLWDK
jgi:hypothetical protein